MPDYPMHPKPSRIRRHNTGVAEGLPEEFTVGRYHSLYAIPEKLPACFDVTAQSAHGVGDAVILGVRRRNLPLEAVQFHPQSILSARDDLGLRPMRNAMRLATRNIARLRRQQFAGRGPPIFPTADYRFSWSGAPFHEKTPLCQQKNSFQCRLSLHLEPGTVDETRFCPTVIGIQSRF